MESAFPLLGPHKPTSLSLAIRLSLAWGANVENAYTWGMQWHAAGHGRALTSTYRTHRTYRTYRTLPYWQAPLANNVNTLVESLRFIIT